MQFRVWNSIFFFFLQDLEKLGYVIEWKRDLGFSCFREVLETSQKERKPYEKDGEIDWWVFIERKRDERGEKRNA